MGSVLTLSVMLQVGGFTFSCGFIEWKSHPRVSQSHLSYDTLKKRAAGDDPNFRMSPGAYLLCSAQASSKSTFFSQLLVSKRYQFAGAATAVITNPIWVVKVRMFTTRADSPTAYRSLLG